MARRTNCSMHTGPQAISDHACHRLRPLAAVSTNLSGSASLWIAQLDLSARMCTRCIGTGLRSLFSRLRFGRKGLRRPFGTARSSWLATWSDTPINFVAAAVLSWEQGKACQASCFTRLEPTPHHRPLWNLELLMPTRAPTCTRARSRPAFFLCYGATRHCQMPLIHSAPLMLSSPPTFSIRMRQFIADLDPCGACARARGHRPKGSQRTCYSPQGNRYAGDAFFASVCAHFDVHEVPRAEMIPLRVRGRRCLAPRAARRAPSNSGGGLQPAASTQCVLEVDGAQYSVCADSGALQHVLADGTVGQWWARRR